MSRAQASELRFFATAPHPCSYLPGRQATTVFADPGEPKNMPLYSALARNGFRRSGEHIYRPHCEACAACVAVRVPVDAFRMRRSQRRVWAVNQDLVVESRDDSFVPEHFELYRRYQNLRHRGGGMDNPSETSYRNFLTSPWSDTEFHEFRHDGQLLSIAVTDRLADGLSAVYSFFDPDHAARSLGVYAILWQIREAQRCGLTWLYLGYWIEETPKMSYKRDYRPQEHFVGGQWRSAE